MLWISGGKWEGCHVTIDGFDTCCKWARVSLKATGFYSPVVMRWCGAGHKRQYRANGCQRSRRSTVKERVNFLQLAVHVCVAHVPLQRSFQGLQYRQKGGCRNQLKQSPGGTSHPHRPSLRTSRSSPDLNSISLQAQHKSLLIFFSRAVRHLPRVQPSEKLQSHSVEGMTVQKTMPVNTQELVTMLCI